MENPEEVLHSLEEFSKMKPKDIPRELEDYLAFVAKTGDPVYQWGSIKSLFREKLINVITEFYESCPVMEIPPCPNVDIFNYDLMKSFILEKLEAFNSAPFTLQRICELLTSPRKEYNRIDKFMRALEKNILVVSTVEPGGRRSNENGDGIVNGIEAEPPVPEPGAEINIEEMDETPPWSQQISSNHVSFENGSNSEVASTNQECIISCTIVGNQPYVSIEPLSSEALVKDKPEESLEVKEDRTSPERMQDNVTSVSEANPTDKSVITDSVTETMSDTPVEGSKPDVCEEKDTAKMQSDKSKQVEERTAETSVVDEVLKEVVTEEPAEAMGIENISPETSTESCDTLSASTNVQGEEKEAEKIEEIVDSTQEKEVEDVCEKEVMTEEKDDNEDMEKTEDKDLTEKTENIEEKPEEESSKDDLGQGDTKINVETHDTESSITDILEKPIENLGQEELDTTSTKDVNNIEEVEVDVAEVEHMNVAETSSEDNKIEENSDPLSIEDKEEEVQQEIREDMSADFKEVIVEKQETETKEDTTPMEVDDVIEEKVSVEKEDPKVETSEEKDTKSDETKAEL